MVFHGFSFRAPLLSFLPLGYSCFVGVHCVPCSSLLSILLVALSFSVFSGHSSIPVSGYLPRPTFCLSLVSFLFFSCLVFLFCALTSGPPGVSPVLTSSLAGHPTSLSSALAASSSTPSGFCFLLTFAGAVLLLAGFLWGLVVPVRHVFFVILPV